MAAWAGIETQREREIMGRREERAKEREREKGGGEGGWEEGGGGGRERLHELAKQN